MEQEHNTVKCPVCGGVLEAGFVQGSRAVSFVKKFRWLRVKEREGDFVLPFTPLAGVKLPARYCKQCDTITISLREEGE